MNVRTTHHLFPTTRTAIAMLCLAVGGFACASLQYGQTVDRFEAARDVAMNPHASEAAKTVAEAEFGEVIRYLDDSRISALKRSDQPDALVMRAYSEWQIGLYGDAKVNARRAQVAPDVVPGSYADLTSRALGGLIIASTEIGRWNTARRVVKARDYSAYENNFVEAMARVDEAASRLAPHTPAETRAFVHYARWRVASDWRWVIKSFIGKRKARPSDKQRQAMRSMRETLGAKGSGTGVEEALSALLLAIPTYSPLRAFAEAESKQPPKRRL